MNWISNHSNGLTHTLILHHLTYDVLASLTAKIEIPLILCFVVVGGKPEDFVFKQLSHLRFSSLRLYSHQNHKLSFSANICYSLNIQFFLDKNCQMHDKQKLHVPKLSFGKFSFSNLSKNLSKLVVFLKKMFIFCQKSFFWRKLSLFFSLKTNIELFFILLFDMRVFNNFSLTGWAESIRVRRTFCSSQWLLICYVKKVSDYSGIAFVCEKWEGEWTRDCGFKKISSSFNKAPKI